MPYHPDRRRSVTHLVEALDSLEAQTYPSFVVAVVLDPVPGHDADDDWAELQRIAASRRFVRTLQLPEQTGPGGARNAGTAVVLGLGVSVVVFLDADDVCEPDRLERLSAAFAADPDAGLVFSAFSLIDETSRPWAPEHLPPSIHEIHDSLSGLGPVLTRAWIEMACERGYFCLTSATAVRAQVARRCAFPETFVSEDTHTWFRMFAESGTVRFLDRRLVRYRVPRVPEGSSSRARSGAAFYWTKAVVDLDGLCRVLLAEVASGRIGETEASDILSRFWQRTAWTFRLSGANEPLQVASALGRLGDARIEVAT
jgi:glycosyltransferase involved in cell wall biosynthesis